MSALNRTTDGTGPFFVTGWSPGTESFELIKNPHYWQPGLPKVSDIIFRQMPDPTSRVAALETGQVQLITALDVSTIGGLQRDPAVKIASSAPAISIPLEMETNIPPFNNPNVREALKLIPNRQNMVKDLLGYAVAGNDQPIPPTAADVWSTKPTPQNIPKVKQLLAAAGYTSQHPLKVTLYISEVEPGATTLAQAYAADAAKAGVDVVLKNIPISEFYNTTWLKVPFIIDSWGVRPPATALPLEFGCNPSYNVFHQCDKVYQNIVNKAEASTNPVVASNLYKKAEQLINDNGGEVTLLFIEELDAMSSKCSGFQPPVPFFDIDFAQFTCK
jgi:peptide/nickel transport system substrate-binding protein